MSRQPVGIHGVTHRTEGSDPLWATNPIFFDVDNQGGYLDITTNDLVAGYGMRLTNNSAGGQRFISNGETGGYGQEFLNNSNGRTLIQILQQAGLEITIPDHDNTGIVIDVHGNDNAGMDTNIAGTNNAGWSLEVSGTGNSGINRTATAGNFLDIIATAGKTYIWKDHLGNPLATLTG